jgi:hypothetical protein
MTETTTTLVRPNPMDRRSAGRQLLKALAARDFEAMPDCFEADATMRAMLPSGPTEFRGATQIVENLRIWFGGAHEFELLNGTIDEVGDRPHVTWRLRLHPTPWGDDAWHVIEQQAYLRAGERITSVDLLCSGFQPDDPARRPS